MEDNIGGVVSEKFDVIQTHFPMLNVLAAKVIKVIDNKILSEKTSKQGLTFVREERNWLNTAKQYLPMYYRLIK